MITENSINVYKSYNGDIDCFARGGTSADKINITDNQWYVIDDVLGRLVIELRGLSSESFNSDTKTILSKNFTEKARLLMSELAKERK